MSDLRKQDYNDESIKALKGAVRIRKRPASMLGSSGLAGARHGFTEIYGNALDEVSSGYGDKLEVTYYKDGGLSVRDFGRGVPIGWNEGQGHWNWHLVFNELYGGSKYDNGQDYLRSITDWNSFDEQKVNYLYSVGLNGLGAASTQYTSEYFDVRSFRDGVCTEMHFKKGIPIINGAPLDVYSEEYNIEDLAPKTSKTDEPNGTFIKWRPDDDVFTDTDIGGDWLYDVCRDIAYVAHIDLVFKNEKTGKEVFIAKGNLSDLLRNKYATKLVTDEAGEPLIYSQHGFRHGSTRVEGKDFIWVCKADVAIAYTKACVPLRCYHNSVKMSGGAQYNGANAAISSFFDGIAKQRGIRLETSDYDDAFTVAVSSYSNYASFKGQTKDEVDNNFIYTIVYDLVYDKLMLEYGKGTPALMAVVERVMQTASDRIASREQMLLAREVKKVTKAKDPSKFSTCKAYMRKDYSITELWITEGDSAAGAVKQARNAEFQAILPVRGKCLNVLKCGFDKIVKSDVIKNIFSLLGTGMDTGADGSFDISALKFDKIIFATDADEDGFQIRVLLFLIFYRLAPELLKQGHVYVAETPRFEIKLTNGEAVFAKTDIERDELLNQYAGQVRAVNRFKGLGEVNADVLRKTTVHPDTRNLVPLTVDFADDATRDLIDALFGADKYSQRKTILTEVLGKDVADMLEKNALLIDDIDESDIDDGVEYQTVVS